MFATLLLTGVTIVLPAKSEVHGTEIQLGEIAEVSSTDAALVESLESYTLGYAPAPGFSRVLRRDNLGYQLRTAFPNVTFTFQGAGASRVEPVTETVLSQSIEKAASDKLNELLAGKDAEVKLAQSIADVVIAAGDRAHELKADWSQRDVRPGRVSMPVQVIVDGELYRTLWTSWDVDFFTSVPLLIQDVQAGEDLTPAMFKVGRLRASKVPLSGLASISSLSEAKSTRALKAGAILTKSDIIRKPLILRGDTVSLEVRKGGVSARVTAIAKQAGYRGDRISVVVTETKREISALVVDRDVVRLDMTQSR